MGIASCAPGEVPEMPTPPDRDGSSIVELPSQPAGQGIETTGLG